MGSFGGVLKGFTKGLETGHRMALANREMNLREYQHGKPPKNETEAIPPIGEGAGTVPVIGGDEAKPGVDPTTTGSVSSAPIPNAGGKSIGDQMYGYYRSKGLSHAAAAGIAGNLMQESGGDPRVVGGHRRGDSGASAFVGAVERLAPDQADPVRRHPDADVAAAARLRAGGDEPATVRTSTSRPPRQASRSLVPGRSTKPPSCSAITLSARVIRLTSSRASPTLGSSPTLVTVVSRSASTASAPSHRAAEPEKKEEEYAGSDMGSSGEEEDTGFEPVESVPLPDVPSVELTSWDQFARPLWQDPTLYAATGGVIPDDQFNKDRAFTQINPTTASGAPSSGGFSSSAARRVGGGGSWTPRAVGQAGAPTMAAGPTPSQLAFRDLPKYQAPAPVAAAPVAAPVQTGTSKGAALAYFNNIDPTGAGAQVQKKRRMEQIRALPEGTMLSNDSWKNLSGKWMFAGGGKVEKLKEGTRRERTMSSRGEEAGQTARDRAARRINVGTSGRSSTAVSPDGYWKKGSTARKKDTALRRAKKGKTAKPKSDTKPKAEPKKKTEFSPDLAVSPNRPDNRPATNAPTNNPPYSPRGPSSIQQQAYVPPPPGSAEIYGTPPPMGAGVLPDDLAVSPWRPDNRPTPPAPPIRRPIPNSGSIVWFGSAVKLLGCWQSAWVHASTC